MNIELKPATEQDLPLMMAWRSNPLCYAGFYSQRSPLVWEGHVKWWRSRNSDWRTFVIYYEERPVGLVNIGQLDHWSPEIGYMVGEVGLWGCGVGTGAVRKGLEWLKDYSLSHTHIKGVHTTILDNNTASIKLIKRLGFKKGMPARKGEYYYYREL